MEAHCSTGDPCERVKEASFFYLRNRCHVVFKKNRIESSHCAFTFYFFNIAPLHQKDNTIHANSCFSALLLIALSSNYVIYSKPLYNLFLIFFLAAVIFIYFNRVFMILCAHRAQLCGKIRLFCCISLFLRNYLFRMCLFAAGWAPCGRDGRFAAHGSRFFAARWVHRAPANGLRCLRRRVCVWWIARPPTGRRSPFTTGCGFAADMPFAFCPPCPAPDSRFPLADLYLRQLLRCL